MQCRMVVLGETFRPNIFARVEQHIVAAETAKEATHLKEAETKRIQVVLISLTRGLRIMAMPPDKFVMHAPMSYRRTCSSYCVPFVKTN